MKKIDFIIIGAMKSGTTSIVRILEQHPSIQISSTKEPMYFLRNKHSIAKNDDEYHKLWTWEDDNVLRGEASTCYTFFPEYKDVPQEIFDYNPDVKLIYVLRDPVKRIESHYAFRVSRKVNKHADPAKEIASDVVYQERSQYFKQLQQYDTLFKKEQMLVVLFEDFISDKQKFFDSIFSFLGVELASNLDFDIWSNRSDKTARVSPIGIALAKLGIAKLAPTKLKQAIRSMFLVKLDKKPLLPEELKKSLAADLQQDVSQLEKRINRDLSAWK